MEPTVFIIVGAVVLLFIIIALFGKGLTPEDIGDIGEARTARYLRKLPTDDYTIFHDRRPTLLFLKEVRLPGAHAAAHL